MIFRRLTLLLSVFAAVATYRPLGLLLERHKLLLPDAPPSGRFILAGMLLFGGLYTVAHETRSPEPWYACIGRNVLGALLFVLGCHFLQTVL